jgi:hypothetical protein
MKNERTMFGKNFKYVLILTALAYIVYTLPMVRAAIGEMSQYQPKTDIESLGQVSSILAGSQVAGVLSSVITTLPPQPKNCPTGYICVPSTMILTWCPPKYQCLLEKAATIATTSLSQGSSTRL